MKYVATRDIPLIEIEAEGRLRRVDPDEVERIKTSMDEIGQTTPIAVVSQLRGPKYRLVAGAHRVAAAQALEWPAIRAEIKQPDLEMSVDAAIRLHEIDENLGRYDLTPLDRAVFVGLRRQIFEELYPERFQRGGDRKSATYRENNTGENPRFDFTKETAGLLDKDETTVRRALAIYGLDDKLRERIAGTPLAKKEGELYALTRQEPNKHEQIVAAWLAAQAAGGKPRIRTIAAALDSRAPAQQPQEEADKAAADKIINGWVRGNRRVRELVFEYMQVMDAIPSFRLEHLYDPDALDA